MTNNWWLFWDFASTIPAPPHSAETRAKQNRPLQHTTSFSHLVHCEPIRFDFSISSHPPQPLPTATPPTAMCMCPGYGTPFFHNPVCAMQGWCITWYMVMQQQMMMEMQQMCIPRFCVQPCQTFMRACQDNASAVKEAADAGSSSSGSGSHKHSRWYRTLKSAYDDVPDEAKDYAKDKIKDFFVDGGAWQLLQRTGIFH